MGSLRLAYNLGRRQRNVRWKLTNDTEDDAAQLPKLEELSK